MHLKKNINFLDFILQVNRCKEDVLFYTNEGDILNLKSTLSRLVFASLTDNSDIANTGYIKVNIESDYLLIKDFLIEEGKDIKGDYSHE